MKKLLLSLTFGLFLMLGSTQVQAQDGYFSNARTLEKGTFTVGIQPVILTEQDDFMMMFRGSYGLAHRITGHLKVGALGDETYVGSHLEANLLSEPESNLSLALLAGVYSYGETGLKLGMNVSHNFDPISLYTGISYEPLFLDNDETFDILLLPLGLDYHVEDAPIDLMLEANVPLNDEGEYLQAVTFGARIYLN